MRKKLFILYFVIMAQIAVAQNYTHEFGKYSNEDFALQPSSKDPLAEAIVIYDIGKSYYNKTDEGLELIFERKMKIKVFSKAGLIWAERTIPFYREDNSDFQRVVELKGNTYNFENGTVRTSVLNPKNAFIEKINEHWNQKKFAMPDVKEGSVFEISYKITSPFVAMMHNWEFQDRIPVLYSEYTIKLVPFYEFSYILQGASKFDEYKTYVESGFPKQYWSVEYNDVVCVYTMKNLPAFRDETYISTADDYIIKLDFQLAALHRMDGSIQNIKTTWPELSSSMLETDEFGKYQKACERKSGEIIENMQLETKSSLEKATLIDRYVKSNFNWNRHSDKYSTKSVKDFLSEKTGNCADINLFLAGILNAAGIEATPVILSTRDHGKIRLNYPFSHFFNYVIVQAKIDSVEYLLDATEPLCVFGEIPSRCLNEKGLVIRKKAEEWVKLKSELVSNTTYNFELQLNAKQDSVIESCKIVSTGYEAIRNRHRFLTDYKNLKTSYLGSNSLQSDTITPAKLNEVGESFVLVFAKKSLAEMVEDKIIISPFRDLVMTENPLKQVTRTYPIDMTYRTSFEYISTLLIPEGYKILSKPLDLKIDNKLISIVFTTEEGNDNSIKLSGVYEFKDDIFAPEEYLNLKNCFNIIVDKFNEKLVLVKEI